MLLGDGRGGLRPAPGSPVSARRRLGRTTTADLDGDGRADVAVPEPEANAVRLWLSGR